MASSGGQRKEKVSAFKIHVKNLPEGTTSDELQAIFQEFGKVVEAVIAQKKKFGFVFMEDEACGRAAITMLNGRSVRESIITVEESTLNSQGPSVPSTRLRVKNIPSTLSALGLRELFTKYGMIISVEITDTEGIVVIEAIADIRSAMKDINGYVQDGQTLTVEPIINTGLSYTPKIKDSSPVKNAPLMRNPQSQPSRPTRPGFNNNMRGRGMPNNGIRSPRMRGGPGMRPLLLPPMNHSPMRPGPRMGFRPPPPHVSEMWDDSEEYGYEDGWGEDEPQPANEGRILRDPYGPGLRPPMSQFRRGSMRPPMGFPAPRPPMMMMRGGPGPRPSFLGRGGNSGMSPQRPLLRPPLASSVGIEPLFHRRHEILPQERQETNYADDLDSEKFYEDEPLDQIPVERVPIYSDSSRMRGSPSQRRGGMMGHSSMRSHPPLQPPPMPPTLFRNGMGPRLKRSGVPEADPGQPFEVPPMIPPGMFQPPRKYFANRPKHETPKRKRLHEPRPELPIPEQPARYVPDYSSQQYVPQGSVLKPFPPPQYNDDFSEDVEFQEQQGFYR